MNALSPVNSSATPGGIRRPGTSGRRAAEGSGHFFRAIGLDDVTDLQVVEVLDADTALEAFAHFADVVLEALQRGDRAVVDLDAIADETHAALPVDHAAAYHAASDR